MGPVLAEACFPYSLVCFLGAESNLTGMHGGAARSPDLAEAPERELHCPSSSGPVCFTYIAVPHPSCPNVSEVASKYPAACPWAIPSPPKLSFPDGEIG